MMTDPTSTESRFLMASARGGREEQQDAAIGLSTADDAMSLLVVSDGVGGKNGGRLAAEQVIGAAEQLWEKQNGELSDPRKDLELLCRTAHDQINAEGAKDGISPRATIVALYFTRARAYWVHSGDSRLYHFRAGKFVQRTEDHSLVQFMVKQQLAEENQMGSHVDQGLLIQSLGGDDYQKPTVDSAAIGPQDAFLVCTDGFWQRTEVEEMAQLLCADKQKAAALLNQAVKRAVERNGPDGDNVTVALALPANATGGATGRLGNVANILGAISSLSINRKLVLAGSVCLLSLLIVAGALIGGRLVNSTGASSKAISNASPAQSPSAQPEPPENNDKDWLAQTDNPNVSRASTPQPQASPDAQVIASPTPAPSESPTAPVDQVDPELVGKWETTKDGRTEIWVQDPDGGFTLSGPTSQRGTLTTEAGKIRQFFPTRGLTQEMTYEVKNGRLLTTGADGTMMEWRVARSYHQPRPRHLPPESDSFLERILRILHFPFR
jgi:serine/threonine protein phosphatase PrpC